jgi:RNA polymerase sigma-70 factor (ECF subfamily)
MYRIATNEAISFIKSKARKKISSESLQNKTIDNLKSDPYFDGDEVQIKLHKAITTSQKTTISFKMKYFEELKYEQISEILGTSVGALKA